MENLRHFSEILDTVGAFGQFPIGYIYVDTHE